LAASVVTPPNDVGTRKRCWRTRPNRRFAGFRQEVEERLGQESKNEFPTKRTRGSSHENLKRQTDPPNHCFGTTMVLFSRVAIIRVVRSWSSHGKLYDVARASRHHLRLLSSAGSTIAKPVSTTINNAAAAIALEDVSFISQVAAEVMEDDKEVMFAISSVEYPIARSILEKRQPNSVLTHLMTEQWKERPFTSVALTHVDKAYFPLVLEYLRNESVQLPFSKWKDHFISEMISLQISFDPSKVESLYRPSVMAQAVLANKEQLQCFKELVIEKELTKMVEDAKNKLDAAKFAHSIVTLYTTEHCLRVDFDDEVGIALYRRFHDNADFRAYCKYFLEKFGLEAKANSSYPFVLELSLKLEDK
jgi:hypothetical protein